MEQRYRQESVPHAMQMRGAAEKGCNEREQGQGMVRMRRRGRKVKVKQGKKEAKQGHDIHVACIKNRK